MCKLGQVKHLGINVRYKYLLCYIFGFFFLHFTHMNEYFMDYLQCAHAVVHTSILLLLLR